MTKPNSRAFRWRHVWGTVLLGPPFVLALLNTPTVVEGSTLDVTLDVLAWLTFLAGTFLRFWSTLYIGGRKGRQVVTDGPYSLCRHPLYLGTFLLTLSAGLFLESLLLILGALLLGCVYAALTIRVEEQHLLAKLGEEYKAYCERTPRLLPDFRKFNSPEFIKVKVHTLGLELRRSVLWLFLPAVAEVVNALRVANWWPHYFHLPWLL
jgi:protein-S-isoprenylcysteine O-methyltransferase Ste14